MEDSAPGTQAYGQPQVPCNECGALPSPPCLAQGDPMQMGGYPQGMMGYPQNMMTPCMECGNLPYAPCLPSQGMGMGGFRPNTPCEECGGIPDAPCAYPQNFQDEPEGKGVKIEFSSSVFY